MDALVNITEKISSYVRKVTEVIVVPVSLAFMLMVFIGVLTRFVFKIPIVASLEFARIGFIWFCMLGSSLAYKERAHIGFTFLLSKLPENVSSIISLCIDLLCLAFFSVIFINSVNLVIRVSTTKFPASGLPYTVMYLALPTAMAFFIIHVIYFISTNLKHFMSGRSESIQ